MFGVQDGRKLVTEKIYPEENDNFKFEKAGSFLVYHHFYIFHNLQGKSSRQAANSLSKKDKTCKHSGIFSHFIILQF